MSFWEYAHSGELHRNWTDISEKTQYIIKATRFIHKQNPKALDVGCSIGNYSIVLAKKGFDVIGIDISKTAIAMARQNAKEHDVLIKFQNDDAKNFSSGKYDLIVDYSCFTHFYKKDWNKYLNNIHALLNDKGIYTLSVWSKNSTRAYGINPSKLKGNGKYVTISGKDGFYNYFFTESIIRKLFSNYKILYLEETKLESLKKQQPGSDLKLFFIILQR